MIGRGGPATATALADHEGAGGQVAEALVAPEGFLEGLAAAKAARG